MKKRGIVSPMLVLGIGILAVSTASIFIRYAQDYASSLVIAFYRLGIAALVLAPVAFFRKRGELKKLSYGEILLALLSGLFLALHFVTWITSLEYTTVASSVVLVSTVPLWVALFSLFTIKEPLTRWLILGLSLALVGGVIVGVSDNCSVSVSGVVCPTFNQFFLGDVFIGDLLALFGAIMAASYLIIGRRLRNKMSLTSYVFVVYGMAAVVMLIIVLAFRQPLFGYPPMGYLWLILLALIPQLLGHSAFNWALGFLSATFVAIVLLGEPIGSTVLAYFLLEETPSWVKIVGGILIIAGIYVASLGETRNIEHIAEEPT
jgi:drug/metabolite transporter (DMT)-like permease